MNLVKWQDTKSIYRKSVAFLYINTNYQKEKLRQQSQLHCIQNNKKSNKFNHGSKRPVF